MPLIHGKSKKAFKENVETEMHEHPERKAQNLAIAYAVKRKAEHKKMAEGGMLTHDGYQDPHKGHTINIHVKPEGEYDPMEHPMPHHNERAMEEDDKDLNQHHVDEMEMAEGGQIEDNYQSEDHEEDMIDRIMKKREMPDREIKGALYSRGGVVSNEDSGESASNPDKMAKSKPNEFDDLALDDDLAFEYTGANSGDEYGSKLNQDDDDEDMIGRIMKKRAMR